MTAHRHRYLDRLDAAEFARPYGVVRRIGAGVIEASGPEASPGSLCVVGGALAEVTAIDRSGITLIPIEQAGTLRIGDRVELADAFGADLAGEAFAGRAVDGLGRPIDGGPPLAREALAARSGRLPPPLDRVDPARPLHTGLRAIDGLLTLGIGQRVGIFAASGVGKSTLVDQLARGIECDRCILCLVGERGREVSASWDARTRYRARRSTTLVAATSDDSPALRVRAVEQALAIADHWRRAGEHVLLVLDSITRYAMAIREIGLAAGEPATIRAYPPSVFTTLPRVVERCGSIRDGGAITAIMTVLSETDDVDDPIVEVMKSLLDGHILLSRSLAESGHYPAIDVPRSISRVSRRIMSDGHATVARQAVAALATLADNRVLIDSGIYRSGSSASIDRALALRAPLDGFLCQQTSEQVSARDAIGALTDIIQAAHV